MPETVNNQIQRTRRRLMGMHRPEFNVVVGATNATSTALTMSWPLRGLGPGSRIAVDDEIMYVWDTDTGSRIARVYRGDLGSTPATHADQARVEVNPRFPKFEIRDVLTEEIRSWPSTLYREDIADATVGAGQSAVELNIPSDWIAILNVTQAPFSTSLTSQDDIRVSYRIERGITRFASGIGLYLDGHVAPTGGMTLTVRIARPFDTTTMVDSVSTSAIGMSDHMLDIPALGAAWRLVSNREVMRTFTENQGEPRRSEEVPPMYATQAGQGLQRLRDKRIAEEAQRLLFRNPWRRVK